MAQYQTVFYEISTGKILHVYPALYIRNKKEKARLCAPRSTDEIGFIYVKGSSFIDPESDGIFSPKPGHAGQLMDHSGLPEPCRSAKIDFLAHHAHDTDFHITFWGQLGDGLEQLAAITAFIAINPSATFTCYVHAPWIEFFSLFYPAVKFESRVKDKTTVKNACNLTMLPSWLHGPWTERHGAASCYGVQLGMDHVDYAPIITLPPSFFEDRTTTLAKFDLRHINNLVAIAPTSTSSLTRSWGKDNIPSLVTSLSWDLSTRCVLLDIAGLKDDLSDDLIDLTGKTTWIEAVHILSAAQHVITVDTAALHVAHALGLTYTCIWGDSTPEAVLGRPRSTRDLCPLTPSTVTGTTDISAEMVFDNYLIQHWDKHPFAFIKSRDTSQHGEQEIIFRYFRLNKPTHNYLVDIGAFGQHISNTYELCFHGWTGLLVEANPLRAAEVEKLFGSFKTKILNIGISDSAGTNPLYIHSIAGQDSFLKDWNPESATNTIEHIACYPLADVLKRNKVPHNFDFLSIDTEGMDEKIMTALFTTSKYRPRLICTETTSYSAPGALFSTYGYELIAQTGELPFGNFIFTKKGRS